MLSLLQLLSTLCVLANLTQCLARHLAYNNDLTLSEPLRGRSGGSTFGHYIRDDTNSTDDLDFTLDDAIAEAPSQCSYAVSWDTLDSLNSALSTIKPHCVGIHTLETLITMLDTAYKNYTTVNDGYDGEFDHYVTYMKNLIPNIILKDFMFNDSIAGDHPTQEPLGSGMKYFDCSQGGSKFPCTDLKKFDNWRAAATSGPTTFTLRDKDGFYKEFPQHGLQEDWIEFGDSSLDFTASGDRASHKYHLEFKNFPIMNRTINIANPKDIVSKAMTAMPQLRADMEYTLWDMMLGQWFNVGSLNDPAQAYSTPVFVLIQGIDNMAQAKMLGKKEEEAEAKAEADRKKNLILLIVSVVLIFVPVVGQEAAAAAGLANVARGIAILGELGNSALAIYDSVENPSSAPLNIMGMLFGLGSIAKAPRTAEGLGAVAKIRAGLKPELLGALFKTHDDRLQSILKVCVRK